MRVLICKGDDAAKADHCKWEYGEGDALLLPQPIAAPATVNDGRSQYATGPLLESSVRWEGGGAEYAMSQETCPYRNCQRPGCVVIKR